MRSRIESFSTLVIVAGIGLAGCDGASESGAGGAGPSGSGGTGGHTSSGGTSGAAGGGATNGGTAGASGTAGAAGAGGAVTRDASGSGGAAGVGGASVDSGRGGASIDAGSGGAAGVGGGSVDARPEGSGGIGGASVDAASDGPPPTGDADGGGEVVVTIKNGVFWNDSRGMRIEAHGGGFIRAGATWYWIGEDKSHNSANFKGVNCYASTDFVNWEFRRAIITRQTAPALDAADRIIERPKVIYHDASQRYVVWLHWEGQNYAEAAAGVFSSSTVDGNYTFHRSFRPNNNMSRDDTLFKDDDGRAYFISAANENADLIVYELTPDYLDIQRQVATLWVANWREAPAIFKQNGTYYLVTSGATGWDPNQAKYATAPSMDGPWSALQNLGNNITFDTQPTYIVPVTGTQSTTYLFASDRWQDPDLLGSKYVWLPLKVSGTSLSLDYYDQWKLNVTRGSWSPYDGFVPHANWKVVYVDSEETSGESGRAINAFDDSASTLWHTQYTGSKPVQPHELQIDLGQAYRLRAMQYLPRLDKDPYGIVAGYEFYVSQTTTDWGTPVAIGTFSSDRSAKRVDFPEKQGRYIRFISRSEISGSALTSMAELDVIGAP